VNALVASGGGDLDYAAIGTVLFKLAGIETPDHETTKKPS
jgi:hypothetical protein